MQVLLYVEGTIYQLDEDNERRQLAATGSSRARTRPHEDKERRQLPAASGAHALEGLGEDTERRPARDSDGSGGDADGKCAEGDSDARRAADVHVAAGREAAAAAGPAERKAKDLLAGPETGRAWESLVGVLR